MSGRTSGALIEALRLVHYEGMVPLHAAKKIGIDPRTMYRSRLNKLRKAGTPEALAALEAELGPRRKRPRANNTESQLSVDILNRTAAESNRPRSR